MGPAEVHVHLSLLGVEGLLHRLRLRLHRHLPVRAGRRHVKRAGPGHVRGRHRLRRPHHLRPDRVPQAADTVLPTTVADVRVRCSHPGIRGGLFNMLADTGGKFVTSQEVLGHTVESGQFN